MLRGSRCSHLSMRMIYSSTLGLRNAHQRSPETYSLTLRCFGVSQSLEGLVEAETDASRLALLAPQHEGDFVVQPSAFDTPTSDGLKQRSPTA